MQFQQFPIQNKACFTYGLKRVISFRPTTSSRHMKKHSKNTLLNSLSGLFIGLSLLFPTISLATSIQEISDVSSQDPRVGIYSDLINSGALSLDGQKRLRPTEPINKAAFFKAAMVYFGYQPSTFNNFTGYADIPEDAWFAPYVKKALEIRAISNTLNENFYPEQTLTRQEGLLLAMRIYGIPSPLTTPKSEDLYTDIRINHPIAAVYASAKKHGIYFENSQENFWPNLTLTRGDAADLLFKSKLAADILSGRSEGFGTISVTPVLVESTLSQEEKELLENEKFGLLLDAWKRIHRDFMYQQNVNNNTLIYGAITGMVDSLDDPYSNFNTPDSDGNSYVYIPEDYEGIGAIIEQLDGQYVVMTTINNSPAYRAGLKSRDIILEIDGKSVNTMTYEQVTAQIKGRAGSILRLKIKRDNQQLNFEIVREKITIESIQLKIVGNQINYLRIDQFTEDGHGEFESHLSEIFASGSKKLIIDLRNNPGGYLSSTQDILGHFLDSNQIEFITVDNNGQQTRYYSNGDGKLKDFRTVVLVNEGSASAAEIFAAALQDYKLARIIGTTTFGKGSVQEITSYYDNSSLKLTIAKWLTPMQRDLNHLGLVPDQIVQISDLQRQSGQDPQLDAAILYLN